MQCSLLVFHYHNFLWYGSLLVLSSLPGFCTFCRSIDHYLWLIFKENFILLAQAQMCCVVELHIKAKQGYKRCIACFDSFLAFLFTFLSKRTCLFLPLYRSQYRTHHAIEPFQCCSPGVGSATALPLPPSLHSVMKHMCYQYANIASIKNTCTILDLLLDQLQVLLSL